MLGSQFLSTPSARRATRYFSAATSSRHSFLSTPSARRATQFFDHRDFIQHDFYPRPPRGGRPAAGLTITASTKISIHALREEGDGFWAAQRLSTTVFLSTPSARRATQVDVEILIFRGISIHALREEGDCNGLVDLNDDVVFLSTPSARRATRIF